MERTVVQCVLCWKIPQCVEVSVSSNCWTPMDTISLQNGPGMYSRMHGICICTGFLQTFTSHSRSYPPCVWHMCWTTSGSVFSCVKNVLHQLRTEEKLQDNSKGSKRVMFERHNLHLWDTLSAQFLAAVWYEQWITYLQKYMANCYELL